MHTDGCDAKPLGALGRRPCGAATQLASLCHKQTHSPGALTWALPSGCRLPVGAPCGAQACVPGADMGPGGADGEPRCVQRRPDRRRARLGGGRVVRHVQEPGLEAERLSCR